jgi:hypothetical protein
MLTKNRRLLGENAELRRITEVLRTARTYFTATVGPGRRNLGLPAGRRGGRQTAASATGARQHRQLTVSSRAAPHDLSRPRG